MSWFEDVPPVVKKWLSRAVRRAIRSYIPEQVTSQHEIRVSVQVSKHSHPTEVRTALIVDHGPIHYVEYTNPVFQNAETDWAELVEVAAWLIKLNDQHRIDQVKQIAQTMGDNKFRLELWYNAARTSYVADYYHPETLNEVTFL